MSWLAIKLLFGGLWGRLRAFLSAFASWATRNPAWALCIALALVSAFLWHEWSVKARQVEKLAGEIKDIRAAQQTATANQIHINKLPAIASAAIARQSDAQAPAYYRSVADAAAGQLRTCPASSPGAADLPRADPPAPVDDRSPAAAVMVSRPKADDDLLVAAAARAARMHQDALDLIAQGVAVPDDAPTP